MASWERRWGQRRHSPMLQRMGGIQRWIMLKVDGASPVFSLVRRSLEIIGQFTGMLFCFDENA
jgi:hypothetical protein